MTNPVVRPDDDPAVAEAWRLLSGVPVAVGTAAKRLGRGGGVYRTTVTDRVVLIPEDEARLTAWMHQHLSLTWAEDEEPAAVEATLVRRLRPPLNVSGVEPDHVQAAVVAAKRAYDNSVVSR
ncbi:GIY-YIG nuclease family protein [Actinoplanes sp. NPDC049596]|uniref:GIY-YIG nuclease family protein n=1 Tax=unclassified Actinoplanes TaxID=2626549 RepID=UPI003421B024